MGRSSQTPETSGHEFNRWQFMVSQYLKSNVHTALPVKVKEVYPTPPGIPEKDRIGFVDVELAIEQVDNEEELIETKPLWNLPYSRIQGGHCGLVIDPEPDDWGWALFCERDISKWKRSLEKCMPDTMRTYDQADGIYLGGILNKKPKLYVQIHPELGIVIETDDKNLTVHVGGCEANIHCEGDVKMQCDSDVEWKVDGDFTLEVGGDFKSTVSGDQTEKASNIYHN